MEAVLQRVGRHELDVFTDYQELAITVRVPAASNGVNALLLTPLEAKAIEWLKRHCKTEEANGGLTLKFHYKGSGIYDESENCLIIEGLVLDLEEHENWEVEILYPLPL